jgi:LDH2 family malate/lactate/ureidoglycolate dehydrogenase
MEAQSQSNYIRVPVDAARTFTEDVLKGNGVSAENAKTVAACLIQADLRGVDSHGVNRIPSYMARIRQGLLDPKAEPTLVKLTPVVAQVG